MPPTSNLDSDNYIKSFNNYTNIVFFNGYITGFITGSTLTFLIMTKKLKLS
jgi:hypothetical protein